VRRGAALLVLASAVCAAGTALGSEHSKLLYSRGLVEFHEEHFDKALVLFDEAVAADPEDVYARYYRAVTRERLKDDDGAIADLELVLKARPDLDQAALDLGVLLVEKQHYQKALPLLRQAQRTKDLAARASLFLGIAQLRLGQLGNARTNFKKAEDDPEQSQAAHYYNGVAAYQQRYWPEAKHEFQKVVTAKADSPLGHEASQFLTTLQESEPRRYAVYGSLGFQYDSNVFLLPSDNALKPPDSPREADGRFTIAAGTTYVPWRSDSVQFALGYDFFQSLHIHVTQFNLEDHGPNMQLVATNGPLQYGALVRYDYYLRSTQSFLQEATALPWVAFSSGDVGRTEIYYRMRRRDFKELTFAVRDAINHAFGARQVVYLGSFDRYIAAGYQYDIENPVVSSDLAEQSQPQAGPNSFSFIAQSYAYDGNEVNCGAGWTFPFGISGEATYAYRYEAYAPESAFEGTLSPAAGGSGSQRRDNEQEVAVAFHKALSEHLGVTAAYFGDFNDSNDSRFEYSRHIGSLAMEVRF